jgi:hypothetical protein
MEGANPLKRKLDEVVAPGPSTNSKSAKQEIHVDFQVILNKSPYKKFRLVLDTNCTFEDVPPKLMKEMSKHIENLGENQTFECSVGGAVLENNQRISKAINWETEVVEFDLTCDAKINAFVYVDGVRKADVTTTIGAHNSYHALLKNIGEIVGNRNDFNTRRCCIDYQASTISVDAVKQVDRTKKVLQKLPSARTQFEVRFVTKYVDAFKFISSFF